MWEMLVEALALGVIVGLVAAFLGLPLWVACFAPALIFCVAHPMEKIEEA